MTTSLPMSARRAAMAISLLVLVGARMTWAQDPIHVVGWNVESGGADPDAIGEQVAAYEGIELWGFTEVESPSVGAQLAEAAGVGETSRYEQVTGRTGKADRMTIVYDADRFSLVRWAEITELNIGGNVRAPMWAELRDNRAGVQFIFMVNHLYRGSDEGRHQQATGLNEWAKKQKLPVIAVGDYNFDWSVEDGDNDHDQGYDNLVADGVFRWVRPSRIVPTQASSHRSVLDFVFLSKLAQSWSATSVIVEDPTVPLSKNDDVNSDHRAVRAEIFPRSAPGPTPFVMGPPGNGSAREDEKDNEDPIAVLEAHARRLEEELRALRAAIEELKANR